MQDVARIRTRPRNTFRLSSRVKRARVIFPNFHICRDTSSPCVCEKIWFESVITYSEYFIACSNSSNFQKLKIFCHSSYSMKVLTNIITEIFQSNHILYHDIVIYIILLFYVCNNARVSNSVAQILIIQLYTLLSHIFTIIWTSFKTHYYSACIKFIPYIFFVHFPCHTMRWHILYFRIVCSAVVADLFDTAIENRAC